MKYQVYLAGAMTCFNDEPEKMWKWREHLELELTDYKIINPVKHMPLYDVKVNEREAMRWDLFQVRHSDVLIVNFNGPSTGTSMEIAIAYDRGIPIIGVNENGTELHPWLTEMCEMIFDNFDDLISYIRSSYY